MVGAKSLSHEAARVLLVCFADGTRNMQVLDGGTVDKAEGTAIIVFVSASRAVVSVVDGDGMAVAVEGASETQALVDAQHVDRKAIGRDGFGYFDILCKLEILAAVVGTH